MSNAEVGSLLFLLFLFISAAHLFGYFFERLRQPRVIGEILAGVALGPSMVGHLAGFAHFSVLNFIPAAASKHAAVMNFIYQLGLLLLMFISGSEMRRLFMREDRKDVFWLAVVGTGLPFFLVLAAGRWLPLERLMGPAHQRTSLLLVVGIAVAVTSIPVISRIFYDLKILHTRFARLVLGVAVIEDIGLWAVLAVATALAGAAVLPRQQILQHVIAALVYFILGLTLAPALLKRLNRARWNFLAAVSPVAYIVAVLFAYAALAAIFDISLVFAAFLAGFALANDRQHFFEALDSLRKFSFAVFIPIYFAIVGYKLDLSRDFSFVMLGVALFAACVVKLLAVSLGARLAGFKGLDNLNLAVATNARGGPGIVLASVAFDAGIINAAFYTTLVLVAVLTSQAAGAWLEYVLRKGWPLLSAEAPAATEGEQQAPVTLAA
ncbi:MAG TPA: cation:proton antiporter [Terriglobales bacterium]|jgi:Kef-type K+ transport system membrane component KefB|nr:cation:proton antiporter [Terriglobales bacterium]